MPTKETANIDIPNELPETIEMYNLASKYLHWTIGVVTAVDKASQKPSHIAVIGYSDEDLDALGQSSHFTKDKTYPLIMLNSGETWFIQDVILPS